MDEKVFPPWGEFDKHLSRAVSRFVGYELSKRMKMAARDKWGCNVSWHSLGDMKINIPKTMQYFSENGFKTLYCEKRMGRDKKMTKLRLLFTDKCNRNCAGCCNKDWDLKGLPICKSYKGYDEIIITGGEPLLFHGRLAKLIREIRGSNKNAKIYLYTAMPERLIYPLLLELDGVTITLHEQQDCERLDKFLNDGILYYVGISFRLNIFKGATPEHIPFFFNVKKDVEWLKNCPLPEGEVFMRVKHL